jgi:hypothetical protein
VVADGDVVYASPGRMYVATTRWDPAPEEGDARVQPVPASPHTLVHAFDLTGDGPARYLVSGSVPGTLLNQFSMSEHEGHLRVATTMQEDPRAQESAVTVLAEQGGALVPVGSVGGLGRGERIYAVRFAGDTGYVVTFRQVDPLYTLDLRDPTAPKVVGELKILGYSAYLHPIGDGLLIGVGQDATEQGRALGTQVSLFDVSDPAAPRRLHQLTLGQGSSAAEHDHHAFLHWPASGLTVIPFQSYDDLARPFPRSGALGLEIGRGGIDEVGRVEHPVGRGGWSAPIERALVVGDRLLTVSAEGIRASDLATLAPGAWLGYP